MSKKTKLEDYKETQQPVWLKRMDKALTTILSIDGIYAIQLNNFYRTRDNQKIKVLKSGEPFPEWQERVFFEIKSSSRRGAFGVITGNIYLEEEDIPELTFLKKFCLAVKTLYPMYVKDGIIMTLVFRGEYRFSWAPNDSIDIKVPGLEATKAMIKDSKIKTFRKKRGGAAIKSIDWSPRTGEIVRGTLKNKDVTGVLVSIFRKYSNNVTDIKISEFSDEVDVDKCIEFTMKKLVPKGEEFNVMGKIFLKNDKVTQKKVDGILKKIAKIAYEKEFTNNITVTYKQTTSFLKWLKSNIKTKMDKK